MCGVLRRRHRYCEKGILRSVFVRFLFCFGFEWVVGSDAPPPPLTMPTIQFIASDIFFVVFFSAV